MFVGAAIAAFAFPRYSAIQREHAIRHWAQKLLRILSIHLDIRGAIPQRETSAFIIAANHISWLDVFLIHSVKPVRFVAKSEIRSWPVAGWLSAKAGTLFIERSRRHHTAKINLLMKDALFRGEPIGLFPEGTISRGDEVKKLHSSLFQAAIESNAPILPIAIRYLDEKGKRSEAAAYVGDISFFASVIEIISVKKIDAVLYIGEPISSTNKSRRDLANETHMMLSNLNSTPSHTFAHSSVN